MSSNDDDPTLWDPRRDNDIGAPADPDNSDGDGDDAQDYSAERPVNLREQRLRARTGDPAPLRLRPAPDPQHRPPGRGGGDPGPGRLSAAEREALREEQLRRVLGTPAGVGADPAGWGWRGKANALGARLAPTAAEITHREAIERIRQPLPGTPVVAVCNPKGGGGTTPATLMLAAIFARHRGHGVVAWDNAEARGTLAARAAHAAKHIPTTWDVLEHAAQLCSPSALASALGRFLLPQPTGEEILASCQSGRRAEMIGTAECAAIMAVLRRHRTMVLLDTPNNDRSQPFRWSIEHATALLIPLTYRRDAAHMVLRTLDGLAARGHTDLIANTVVVLAEGSAVNPAARTAVREALTAAEVGHILSVPYDPVLAGGERIVTARLPETTVRAWTQVAAVLADVLATVLAAAEPVLAAPVDPESWPAPTPSGSRPATAPPPDHPAWHGQAAAGGWPEPTRWPSAEHDTGPAGERRWPRPGEAAR